MKDKIIEIIKEKYPHYTGNYEFDKIAIEFKNTAKTISIDNKNYIYIMTKKRVIIEEVINKLSALSGLFPEGMRYAYNPDDTIVHLISEDEKDYLDIINQIDKLLALPDIKKIVKILKEIEEKEYQEYYFSDFYFREITSIRTIELKLKERDNETNT